MKQQSRIKLFALSCTLLLLTACLHTTKVGFLVIRNSTDATVTGQGRYAHQQDLDSEFTIAPGRDYMYEKYDINPSSRNQVLERFVVLKLSKPLNSSICSITLNNNQMSQHATYEGVSVIVHVPEKLFSHCQ